MQISDIHSQALQFLNSDNSDYESAKLMPYTQDGIAYIQNQRIAANDPDVITQATTTFASPITKPNDFFCFIPQKSSYPIIIDSGKIKTTSSSYPQVTFKYAQKVARVNYTTDTFPLPDEFAGFVAQYISIRLQSDNSMDVLQDINLLQADIQAFLKAKGG